MVAVCEVVTPATVALNPVLLAPDPTVTIVGTITAGLLLVRATWIVLLVIDVRLTVHESACAPVTVLLLQFTDLRVGTTVVPEPLKLTVAVGALLAMVNSPVAELAVVGLN